jgi:hypothetical protein
MTFTVARDALFGNSEAQRAAPPGGAVDKSGQPGAWTARLCRHHKLAEKRFI